MAVLARIRNAFNAFLNYEQNYSRVVNDLGPSTYGRSTTFRLGPTNERSIITSIYTRIAVDVAGVVLRHVKVDKDEQYLDDIDSQLSLCLNFEPNIDQGPRHFRQDIVSVLIDRGVAAVVPVDTVVNADGSIDIYNLRVGEITQWYSHHIRVNLYNEAKGIKEEIVLEKSKVAIVENPLYDVMNGPNSTMQRLVQKLNALDAVDASASRLDMIIQLPYTVRTEAKRAQAETRRSEIEYQLKDSEYGIAYSDATEKITQLNRPVENQLLAQVDRLTKLLYSQLSITETVMDGTADEATMINYYNRTVAPMLDAMKEAMTRSFLGLIKYKEGERVLYFRDPFKLVPLKDIAEIADVFSRNEIFSSNEIRGYMGVVPSKEPKADALINSNNVRYTSDGSQIVDDGVDVVNEEPDPVVQDAFNGIDKTLDDIFDDLEVV